MLAGVQTYNWYHNDNQQKITTDTKADSIISNIKLSANLEEHLALTSRMNINTEKPDVGQFL